MPIEFPRATDSRLRRRKSSGVLPAGCATGVGQPCAPVEPLADVRRTDARSAQIGGPDDIAQRFQVSAYSGEPVESSASRNLLSKHDWRAALCDEPV